MRSIKKLISILLIACILAFYTGCGENNNKTKTAKDLKLSEAVTINIWYNDSSYEKYLNFVAEEIGVSNELITVVPTKVEADFYINYIYEETIKNNNVCDIFLMSSEECEKAYLMGLMLENDSFSELFNKDIYGEAAITSCSYNDKLVGYPVSYNTSFLIYNTKYAEEISTFEELKNISENFKVTEENQDVSIVFEWEPSSMFLNYAIAGAYMNVGGDNAEDGSVLELDFDNIKKAMEGLSKYRDVFGGAIERGNVTQEESAKLFAEGRLMYTILEADYLSIIDESDVEYMIAPYPATEKGLETRPLSITNMAVVNPYTKNIEVAEVVAKAISYDYADYLEKYAGKCCARGHISNSGESTRTKAHEKLHDIYSGSAVKAKYVGVGEIYMRYEILLHQIWNGTDIDKAFESFKSIGKE